MVPTIFKNIVHDSLSKSSKFCVVLIIMAILFLFHQLMVKILIKVLLELAQFPVTALGGRGSAKWRDTV